MLLIRCPYCEQELPEIEFRNAGEAHIARPTHIADETDDDFEQTRQLFAACNYDMAYIFKYSVRSGTPAANLGDQVPEAVKETRNQILLDLLRRNSERRNATLLGTTQEVLVEGPDKKGLKFMGRTRGNRIVHFDADPRLVGELVPVKIERASAGWTRAVAIID